ncbi:ZP domain-containing protein-like [Stylophora pistillata]|uniref:ZP domain-containing protein-like n=1 Tax=Stylophora pistillata TaxID=50429 RepID=UPI000C04A15D|nr:ZP domain-containing protein-like [Stylophora pistillata]
MNLDSCLPSDKNFESQDNSDLRLIESFSKELRDFLGRDFQQKAEPIDSVITREHDFELPFKCNYSRKDIPNLDVLPRRRSLPPLERQGNLTFRFEIYRSSAYASPHTSYPVQVTLNEDMYLRYSVESSADLVVMALNCKATNGSRFYSGPEYSIIQDGCPMDKTLEQSYDPYSSSQTFRLRAFRFLNDYDSFYLHCELLACDRDSEKSRCRQGCSPPEIWMKRQLKSVVDTTGP